MRLLASSAIAGSGAFACAALSETIKTRGERLLAMLTSARDARRRASGYFMPVDGVSVPAAIPLRAATEARASEALLHVVLREMLDEVGAAIQIGAPVGGHDAAALQDFAASRGAAQAALTELESYLAASRSEGGDLAKDLLPGLEFAAVEAVRRTSNALAYAEQFRYEKAERLGAEHNSAADVRADATNAAQVAGRPGRANSET